MTDTYKHSGKLRHKTGRQGVKENSRRRRVGEWLFRHFDPQGSVRPNMTFKGLIHNEQEKWCEQADQLIDFLRKVKEETT